MDGCERMEIDEWKRWTDVKEWRWVDYEWTDGYEKMEMVGCGL